MTLCVGCGLAITDAVDRLAAKHSDQHSGDVRPPDSNVEGARVSLREAGTLPFYIAHWAREFFVWVYGTGDDEKMPGCVQK